MLSLPRVLPPFPKAALSITNKRARGRDALQSVLINLHSGVAAGPAIFLYILGLYFVESRMQYVPALANWHIFGLSLYLAVCCM